MKKLVLLALATLEIGCFGRMSLAPHLNRERDMTPAAASGRWESVLDQASEFERQNAKSKDVHWYRVWRAAALIRLGRTPEGYALLQTVTSEMADGSSGLPAQPDRLRMFAYDLEAEVHVAEGRPADALAPLERALALAPRVEVESPGDCDREIATAARHAELSRVAGLAGDEVRRNKHAEERRRYAGRFGKCVSRLDFLSLRQVEAMLDAPPAPLASLAIPPTNAPARAPDAVFLPPPSPVAPALPPAPPPAAPSVDVDAMPISALPVARGKYAPIDASPYQAGLDAWLPLAKKGHPKATTQVVIRIDGAHRAALLGLGGKPARMSALVPLFRQGVVFFDLTRGVDPGVEWLIIDAGDAKVLASKKDVFDLFQERTDEAGFAARLQRLE